MPENIYTADPVCIFWIFNPIFKDIALFSDGIRDRIFTRIQFKRGNQYGIAWTDFSSPVWTVLEFATYVPIRQIDSFSSDLVIILHTQIETEESNQKIMCKFHKIPMW